ncbi:hypothetical protein [Dietzia sp. PP-33]|uniref:hypothetical protein n=1 Tax=Dietzia sp. PP-33 TaxID=2957500 RepID=UPI0029A82B2A|nr:hypothetical protein [Dietzia sp. PP-33]MDX2359081.1 hypothetical protein [Dietzia sp. PP-33]
MRTRVLLSAGAIALVAASCAQTEPQVLSEAPRSASATELTSAAEPTERESQPGRFIARCATEADGGTPGMTIFTDGTQSVTDHCLSRYYIGVQPAPGALYVADEDTGTYAPTRQPQPEPTTDQWTPAQPRTDAGTRDPWLQDADGDEPDEDRDQPDSGEPGDGEPGDGEPDTDAPDEGDTDETTPETPVTSPEGPTPTTTPTSPGGTVPTTPGGDGDSTTQAGSDPVTPGSAQPSPTAVPTGGQDTGAVGSTPQTSVPQTSDPQSSVPSPFGWAGSTGSQSSEPLPALPWRAPTPTGSAGS